ncbi:MAG: tRNA-uridine aminocarboxypropyltransferase [Campylobacterota bacterium]|nr:tRNA-uridine aminocarboxypropyltransferase [Campylobacterota bacterium]
MTLYGDREKCYKCYRPMSSCMCKYIKAIDTKTKFIILMHPKEFQKTKNNTGRFTHLSLNNSELIIGKSFADNRRVHELINDKNISAYVLYPSENSVSLNAKSSLHVKKKNIIFIIDATWSCAKTILRDSPNLDALQKLSFVHNKVSQYQIKLQPEEHYLSTIESTLSVLELLNENAYEDIEKEALENFLNPFKAMINYQIECIKSEGREIRYKKSH